MKLYISISAEGDDVKAHNLAVLHSSFLHAMKGVEGIEPHTLNVRHDGQDVFVRVPKSTKFDLDKLTELGSAVGGLIGNKMELKSQTNELHYQMGSPVNHPIAADPSVNVIYQPSFNGWTTNLQSLYGPLNIQRPY